MGARERDAAIGGVGTVRASGGGSRGRGIAKLFWAAAFLVACGALAGRSGEELALAAPEPAWPMFACRAAAMALDGRGVLYVADARRGEVLAILPDGERVELARGLADPGGLAVDGRRRVYVSSPSQGVVYRIEPTGRMRQAATGLPEPGALAVDRDGNLYVSLGAAGKVVRIPWRALEEGAGRGEAAPLP